MSFIIAIPNAHDIIAKIINNLIKVFLRMADPVTYLINQSLITTDVSTTQNDKNNVQDVHAYVYLTPILYIAHRAVP